MIDFLIGGNPSDVGKANGVQFLPKSKGSSSIVASIMTILRNKKLKSPFWCLCLFYFSSIYLLYFLFNIYPKKSCKKWFFSWQWHFRFTSQEGYGTISFFSSFAWSCSSIFFFVPFVRLHFPIYNFLIIYLHFLFALVGTSCV